MLFSTISVFIEQVGGASGHTFQEFLACIFLEESLVGNWLTKIVDHELEDWLNLFFRIAGIMCESSIL